MMAFLKGRGFNLALMAAALPVGVWLIYQAVIRTMFAEDIGYHSATVLNVIDRPSEYGLNLRVLVQIADGRTGTYHGNQTLLPAIGEVICVRATAIPGGGLARIWKAQKDRCRLTAP